MIREHYPKTQMDKSIAWTSWVQGVPKQITARLELIDKEAALRLLGNSVNVQRPLIKTLVEKIAQAMNYNEYIDAIANPIFISESGRLLDGQHRLNALALTDKAIYFLVIRGLPEETFVYFDQNRPRNAVDVVRARGITGPDKVAGVVKLLFQLVENNKKAVPRMEILDRIVQDYNGIESAVTRAQAFHDDSHIVTSVGATLVFLYQLEYPELYNQFFDLIQYGGGTNEQYRDGSHPVAQLKKKIVFDWKRRGGDSRKAKSWANLDERYQSMSIIHQAFMHFVNNKYTIIRWKTDHSTHDDISNLCRKHINIRYSYKRLGEAEDLPF